MNLPDTSVHSQHVLLLYQKEQIDCGTDLEFTLCRSMGISWPPLVKTQSSPHHFIFASFSPINVKQESWNTSEGRYKYRFKAKGTLNVLIFVVDASQVPFSPSFYLSVYLSQGKTHALFTPSPFHHNPTSRTEKKKTIPKTSRELPQLSGDLNLDLSRQGPTL